VPWTKEAKNLGHLSHFQKTAEIAQKAKNGQIWSPC
jgi:hypothetical protein